MDDRKTIRSKTVEERFIGNTGNPTVTNYSDEQKLSREMMRLAKKAGILGQWGVMPDNSPTFKDSRHAWRSYKQNVWDGANAIQVALDLNAIDNTNVTKEQALEAIAARAEDEEFVTNPSDRDVKAAVDIEVIRPIANPEERLKKQREKIAERTAQRKTGPSNIGYGDETEKMEPQLFKGDVPHPEEDAKQSKPKKQEEELLGAPHSAIPTSGTGYPEDNAQSHSAKLEDPEEELKKVEAKRQELLEKCRQIHAQKVASVCEFIMVQDPETLQKIQNAINKTHELNKGPKQDFSTIKVEVNNG